MFKKKWIFIVLALAPLISFPKVHFFLGGKFINLAYRFQDHVPFYDSDLGIQPRRILQQVLKQNAQASLVRSIFPRSSPSPLVAIFSCMDARIDTVELMGDTRKYYHTLRAAGSVLDTYHQEMLALAVEKGVRVILLTRHSDCAAEKLLKSDHAHDYPTLVEGLLSREALVRQFLERPKIKQAIQNKALMVVEAEIDTHDGKLIQNKVHRAP